MPVSYYSIILGILFFRLPFHSSIHYGKQGLNG